MLLLGRKSSNLALGASVIALSVSALATAAFAQEEKKEQEVVIVTATGRAKAVQDIPVALTAVTAQTIQSAGITDVRNLQQVAPAYKVQTGQSNASSAQIQIRGIGTGSDNPGYEGAVAVFVDGVYRNRSGVALTDLPKVDRIEILRGPQGTLFGRNTSAGAVSITTASPKFEPNTYGKLEFGNFGLISGSAGHTDKLTDNTAWRVEFGGTVRDGLLHEVNTNSDVNDRNRWYFRAQTLSEFGDNASLRLIADVAATDEVCCSAVRVKSGSLAPAIQAVAGIRGIVGIPPINERAAQIANTPGRALTEKVDDKGLSAEFNLKTGLGKFTSITAMRQWDLLRGQDVDFSGLDRVYRDNYTLGFDTFTQEFRLNGNAGKLDWLVGAFYMSEKTKFNDSIKYGRDAAMYVDAVASGIDLNGPAAGGTGFSIYRSLPGSSAAPYFFQAALTPTLVAQLTPLVGATLANTYAPLIAGGYAAAIAATAPVAGEGQQKEYSDVDTKSFAIFTHNIYELTDKDKLTVGLRYNTEKKEVNSDFQSNARTCAALQSTSQVLTGIPVTYQGLTSALQASSAGAILGLLCNPVSNTVANGKYNASNDEDAVSGTLSFAHNYTKDLMVYATYSRGYKSGGFNYDRPAFNINPAGTGTFSVADWRVKPEFTDNYELGWKIAGLPGRTTLNGAVFFETITDYQMNAWTGFNFRSFNVDKMVSKGVELDLVSRPIEGLTLTGGALINDAYYDTNVVLPNTTAVVINKGQQLATAPRRSFTASLNYRAPIAGTDLAWQVYVDGMYNSKTPVQTLFGDTSTVQDDYAVFNARLGLGGQNGHWSVELWGRNLTDELYHNYALGIPEQTGEFAVYKSEPKMYGLTLRANF